MTFSRPLLVPLVLFALLAPAGTALSAPADSGVAAGSGGAPAGPPVQSRGGGSVAPATTEAGSASEAGDSGDGGRARARVAGGGAHRPGRRRAGIPAAARAAPSEGGEEQPADPDEPVEEPSDDGATGPAGDTPDGGGEAGATDSGYAFLPSTGLEVATLAVIGLGLLMLGSALFPRRRVAAGGRR